jgi:transposase
VEQQALQGLHRTRSLWMGTRTSRINALRGFCREFGISIAQGSRVGVESMARVLADPGSAIPGLIRGTMKLLIEEIRLLEVRIAQLERELTELARHSPACSTLLSIPGIGLLTATAMVAATGGTVTHFQDARHFASWFGLTPREFSSGGTRTLGASPSAGTAICGCCSPTVRVACCAPPVWRANGAGPWKACGIGRSPSRDARITTRRPVPWRTRWHASATRTLRDNAPFDEPASRGLAGR